MNEKFAILIADDNANNRFALRSLLSRLADCTLFEADSGEAALLATVEHRIHLILLDVQMPGMDGFETARHLLMTERTRNIPVVFVTAVFKAEEFKAHGFELGAVDYLTKPIDDGLLLSRIRLYKHIHEREMSLEAAVNKLVENEQNLLQAKAVAEAATRELEANIQELRKLSSIVEQSPYSLIITDIEGIIEYVNPAFVDSSGYATTEAIGRRPNILKSGETPAATYQEFWRTIRSGQAWRGELKNRRKDGEVYWDSVCIVPIRDVHGTVSHFAGILVDITEKVLAQESLRVAKNSAEAANLAKSAFLANMSHEIRTPLNAIIGMTHILRQGDVTPIQADRLAKIDMSAEHLLHTINDILDLSKIEAGKIVLEDVPVDIDILLANVKSIQAASAEAKGLDIELVTGTCWPRLLGDSTRLQQALINYVGNAIKFTESGSVTLRAVKQDENADQVVIRFEVQDTGIGIAREVLPRLFNAFSQADTSTTRKYGGTGLGLVITRRLAELMGGEAGVVSNPGGGSTFWFTARLRKSQDAGERLPHLSPEAEQLLRQRHTGRRVLIVDDEPLNLEVAAFLLEETGLMVDSAEDGLQAVKKAGETDYAAILMDMLMPNLDGLDATRQIRMLPKQRYTPILAMTANAFVEDKMRCLEAGMDDFIAKPLNAEVLYATLLNLLEQSRIS